MNTKAGCDYRMAMYAAVATLHFYRKDIVPIASGETYGDFATKNIAVIDRVMEEILNVFGYELSLHQIGGAIKAYADPGISVSERPAFFPQADAREILGL